MKDDESLPIAMASSATPNSKKDASDSIILGKGRYKFWALAAILLLAFWSMFTGTVTLRWSAGNLNEPSEDFESPIHENVDVLEMEEREKVVKHMWDVYRNGRGIRLARFWRQAFEAAYEELSSDDGGIRDSAITEIAKMSVSSIFLHSPPLQSTSGRELTQNQKLQAKGGSAFTSKGSRE